MDNPFVKYYAEMGPEASDRLVKACLAAGLIKYTGHTNTSMTLTPEGYKFIEFFIDGAGQETFLSLDALHQLYAIEGEKTNGTNAH